MNKQNNINDLIILVVGIVGCVYGRTYMQKLFFLIEKELFNRIDLNYVKYHYGPYSRLLRDGIQLMISDGFIKESISISDGHEGHCYELTTKGKKHFDNLKITEINSASKLSSFCNKYKHYSPSEILRLVYSKYPSWTVNSVLVN